MANFIVIIPARMHSTRLPNKALADIGGKPMVVRVAERAKLSQADHTYIATDDVRIIDACKAHHLVSILTDTEHPSGTARLAEAVDHLALNDEAIIVNVQGDEPFIDPLLINELATYLAQSSHLPMATACAPITNAQDLFNPNIVKVVLNQQHNALYFSRAPIPFARDFFTQKLSNIDEIPQTLPAFHHIGIYAYRAGFLRQYRALSSSPLETFEALEQLRILWHGFQIGVMLTENRTAAGVDTAEDLLYAQKLWQQQH